MTSPEVIESIRIGIMVGGEKKAEARTGQMSGPECGFPPDSLVVVGLGANLGEPLAQLRGAVQALSRHLNDLRVSRLYESEPIGPAQPVFTNAAVAGLWSRPLVDLLDKLQMIEASFGRERQLRWGPRTLDLDLLWAGNARVDTPRLRVPHPRLLERRFAMQPLLDVVQYATCPTTGELLSSVIERLPDQGVVCVADSGWAR